MFSDTYPFTLVEDEQVYRIAGKMTTETQGEIDDSLIGGNKSAEGADEDEGAESSKVSGVDVVLANRLVETGFGKKKDYQAYIKDYMGKIVEKMKADGESDEAVKKFKSGASSFVKKVLDDFKEFQYYTGESMNSEGSLAYVRWEDEKPYVYFIKAALDEEKV